MTRLYAPCIRHPLRTILAGIVLSLAAGSGLTRLGLDTDGRALADPKAPEILYDREVRATFHVEDQLVVVVETAGPAGIWNLHTLRLLDELTRRLAAVAGVDPRQVTSLATEHSRQSRGAGALDFRTFLDPFPRTAEEVASIRKAVTGMRIYNGTLLSKDESAAAILIGVGPGVERSSLYGRVRAAVAALGAGPETIHVVGAPVAESLLGTHILADLATLVPISMALMGLLFYARYRSLAAVLLPLTEIGTCLLFVFGLMGYAGVPVSLTITVLPVILIAVGVADEIYIFDRSARTGSVLQAMDELWRPMLEAGLTTSAGFLSFTLSPIAPVRHFGMFTAVGVLFCTLWSQTVIPAGLVFRRRRLSAGTDGSAWPLRFARLGSWVLRRRRAILAAAVLVALAIPFGLRRVTVQDSWLDGFAPGSPFRRSTERVDRLFDGTHLLFVCFDARPGTPAGELRPVRLDAEGVPERLELSIAGAPGLDPAALIGEELLFRAVPREQTGASGGRADLPAEVTAAERRGERIRLEVTPALTASRRRFLASLPPESWSFESPGERLFDPRLLERLRRTGGFISSRLAGGRGGVLDLPAQLAVVHSIVAGGKEEARGIEKTALGNRLLVTLLGRVRGRERLAETLDGARRQALITVLLAHPSFVSVGRLMAELRTYARRELAPMGVRIGFAGDVAVSQAMIEAIVTTQVRSLALSLLGVFAVIALLGRSLRLGLLCLLPPAVAVLVNFSLMGWTGIPLGVATSMFSAMAIGLGVDFAIHLTERFRSLPATQPAGDRLLAALSVTGPAIATCALGLAAGFGVMMLSRVPPVGRLGLFGLTTLLTCFLSTLLLLPLILVRRRGWRERRASALAAR
jgi:predicted RND superfamily exporter protein